MAVPQFKPGRMKYTPEAFEKGIVEYFQAVEEENKQRKLQRFTGEKLKPYTLSGICVYLGISRETWREYSNREDYAQAIKQARMIVENFVEEGLLNGSINPIGGIFNLKNNFGWVDKIELSTNQQQEKLDTNQIRKQLENRNKTAAIEGEVVSEVVEQETCSS